MLDTTAQLLIAATNRLHAAIVRLAAAGERADHERGEGVISTAIAILIIAFLGVAAYTIFNGLLSTAGDGASKQLAQYGG